MNCTPAYVWCLMMCVCIHIWMAKKIIDKIDVDRLMAVYVLHVHRTHMFNDSIFLLLLLFCAHSVVSHLNFRPACVWVSSSLFLSSFHHFHLSSCLYCPSDVHTANGSAYKDHLYWLINIKEVNLNAMACRAHSFLSPMRMWFGEEENHQSYL